MLRSSTAGLWASRCYLAEFIRDSCPGSFFMLQESTGPCIDGAHFPELIRDSCRGSFYTLQRITTRLWASRCYPWAPGSALGARWRTGTHPLTARARATSQSRVSISRSLSRICNAYASWRAFVYFRKDPWACVHDKCSRKPTLSSPLSVALCSPNLFLPSSIDLSSFPPLKREIFWERGPDYLGIGEYPHRQSA